MRIILMLCVIALYCAWCCYIEIEREIYELFLCNEFYAVVAFVDIAHRGRKIS